MSGNWDQVAAVHDDETRIGRLTMDSAAEAPRVTPVRSARDHRARHLHGLADADRAKYGPEAAEPGFDDLVASTPGEHVGLALTVADWTAWYRSG